MTKQREQLQNEFHKLDRARFVSWQGIHGPLFCSFSIPPPIPPSERSRQASGPFQLVARRRHCEKII
jgi:hypothetical protein